MRPSGRKLDQMRDVSVEIGFTKHAEGSALIKMGDTHVLCTASIEPRVPPFIKGSGLGWVTAEYGMLPGSSDSRIRRDSYTKGRQQEISRLIGRALRAVVDTKAMGEGMVRVDCDVIEADGGTRTAAVTGAWIALHQTFEWAVAEGKMTRNPIIDQVAAVSVGIVEGETLLDLEYVDDVNAEVDLNVVMSGRELLIEVQGTAEGAPFSREDLDGMLDLAAGGISELVEAQKAATAP